MCAILAPSAAVAGTFETGDQQDRADGGDQQRQAVLEPHVDRPEAVEQQHQTGHGGHHPGDERRAVEPPHAQPLPPSFDASCESSKTSKRSRLRNWSGSEPSRTTSMAPTPTSASM